MPFVATLTSNAPRHQPVHDQRPNFPLRLVVRRTGIRRIVDEQKITLAVFLETLRQRHRLVVLRNATPDRLLNRVFMSIHQSLETDFRQFVLPVNRREHPFHALEQPFAVRLRVVERRQELDLADQVRPTELEKRFRLFFVFQISREEVAADATEKIVAECFLQDLAAARGVDLEEREKLRDETPGPLQLPVLLETRFVDVEVILPFQEFGKLFVRRPERGRGLLYLLHQEPGRDVNTDDVTEILLESAVGNVTPAFEIGGHDPRSITISA